MWCIFDDSCQCETGDYCPVHKTTLLERVARELEIQAAINANPVNLKLGKAHHPQCNGQIQYQKCGGGRRVIRRAIGGS